MYQNALGNSINNAYENYLFMQKLIFVSCLITSALNITFYSNSLFVA